MDRTHFPEPWHVESSEDDWYEAVSANGDVLFKRCWKTEADRIVACINACADIPTEALTSLDWQLAPKAGARPVDVAKLILTLSKYREALRYIVGQLEHEQDWQAALAEANEALKP